MPTGEPSSAAGSAFPPAPLPLAEQDQGGVQPPPLERVHILPFVEADQKLDGQCRLDFLAPELRRKRSCKEVIRVGELISHEELEFAIIKCEPPGGTLSVDTNYFLEGDPLVCFEKIQFSVWGLEETTSEVLFSKYIRNYFTSDYAPYGSDGAKRVRLFYNNQIFQIGDVYLQVEATEPAGLGVVTKETEVFTIWDQTPEFQKVHIVPFQDTLPRAYEFDIFLDYIKPYLEVNPYRKFCCSDMFMYHGVQFKMVACEPDIIARIGHRTKIYTEGNLHPSLRNLLPPTLLSQVQQLPWGLQMMLLNTERTTQDLQEEDMSAHREGLFEDILYQVEKFAWPPSNTGLVLQRKCVICLGDFATADDCRRLPCGHVYHTCCIDEWLRRCTDCPICKDNVDKAIRHQ